MQDLQFMTFTSPKGTIYDVSHEVFHDLNLTASPWAILMQVIVKMMFTTPGTDTFFPTAGAGFQKLKGGVPKTPSGADTLKVQVATGIKDIDKQIRAYQSKETSIPPSGRLKTLRLSRGRNIAIIRSTKELLVPIDVITYDGATTQFGAPVSLSGGSN